MRRLALALAFASLFAIPAGSALASGPRVHVRTYGPRHPAHYYGHRAVTRHYYRGHHYHGHPRGHARVYHHPRAHHRYPGHRHGYNALYYGRPYSGFGVHGQNFSFHIGF